jgi:hypothetical protein
VEQKEEKDFLLKTLKTDQLKTLMVLMQLLILKNQEKVQEEDLKDSLKVNYLKDLKDSQKVVYLKEVSKVQKEDSNGVKNQLLEVKLPLQQQRKFQLLSKIKVFDMIIHK